MWIKTSTQRWSTTKHVCTSTLPEVIVQSITNHDSHSVTASDTRKAPGTRPYCSRQPLLKNFPDRTNWENLHHENFLRKVFLNENFPIYSTCTHTWETSMATEVTLPPISLFVIPEQEFTKIVIAATHWGSQLCKQSGIEHSPKPSRLSEQKLSKNVWIRTQLLSPSVWLTF